MGPRIHKGLRSVMGGQASLLLVLALLFISQAPSASALDLRPSSFPRGIQKLWRSDGSVNSQLSRPPPPPPEKRSVLAEAFAFSAVVIGCFSPFYVGTSWLSIRIASIHPPRCIQIANPAPRYLTSPNFHSPITGPAMRISAAQSALLYALVYFAAYCRPAKWGHVGEEIISKSKSIFRSLLVVKGVHFIQVAYVLYRFMDKINPQDPGIMLFGLGTVSYFTLLAASRSGLNLTAQDHKRVPVRCAMFVIWMDYAMAYAVRALEGPKKAYPHHYILALVYTVLGLVGYCRIPLERYAVST
mmetsp:Transcript_24755/g.38870  ORF Transcript_24755/g.38870 Transcript_24755/m.38870 type:complete len:300 (-) Transcript_24755:615-1514(-)